MFENLMPRTAFWGSFINHDSSDNHNPSPEEWYRKEQEPLSEASRKRVRALDKNLRNDDSHYNHAVHHEVPWHHQLQNHWNEIVNGGHQLLNQAFNPKSHKKKNNTTTKFCYNSTGLYIAN